MTFFNFITEHGLDTALIGLITVILTGLIKMPIKYLASKSANSKKITRFITFLPIIIGFGVTALLTCLAGKNLVFEEAFFAQWLSSVSFSLAIYAFWEKFVPSEKKVLLEAEIETNRALVEELKGLADNQSVPSDLISAEEIDEMAKQCENEQTAKSEKIILTNNKNK